ncbi:MAG: asparaginase [Caldimonas sp.]
MSRPKILLVSLGGTITMTRSAAGGIAPSLSAADLLRAVPGIEAVAEIETASPLSMPGASLSIDNVLAVAAMADARFADGVDGIVVIQGTDTIEETAFLLDLVVRSEKPVVVTGAMRGPEAAGADGPANILAATIVAALRDAVGLGTLVVLNDEIHAARFVQKSHTALPSAFTSPLAGPLGSVVEGRARLHLSLPRRPDPIRCEAGADAPVALLRMSLGDDGRMLRHVGRLGYRGLVLEGMGAGHVPAAVAPIVSELVATMPVVLASRVHSGPAFRSTYGFAGSEIDLLGRGAIPAGRLSSLKARLLLSLLLRSNADRTAIAQACDAYS